MIAILIFADFSKGLTQVKKDGKYRCIKNLFIIQGLFIVIKI